DVVVYAHRLTQHSQSARPAASGPRRSAGEPHGTCRIDCVVLGPPRRFARGRRAREHGGMRVHIPVQRRWGDQDALGHINNVSMLKLLEEARLRAFWRDGADDSPVAVFDESSVAQGGSVNTLIARQEIEYLTPAPYGRDPLDVQLWIGRLGGSSAEICYEVMSPAGDEQVV